MLDYMYEGNYITGVQGGSADLSERVVSARDQRLPLHAKVYALGEKYNVIDLRFVAMMNVCFEISRCPELTLQDEFRDTVEYMFKFTGDPETAKMRLAIFNTIHIDPDCLDQPEIQALLQSIPDF